MTTNLLDERQCTAKSKRSGVRCRRAAIVGGRVCSFHGGNAPQVRAAAAGREVEARAEFAVRNLEGTPVTDPVGQLLRIAGAIVELERFLRAEAERLSTIETWSPTAGEEIRATLRAYERALDRSARVLAEINRLGLEDRAQRLRAAEVGLLGGVLERALARLGLSAAQWELVRVVMPEELERAAVGS